MAAGHTLSPLAAPHPLPPGSPQAFRERECFSYSTLLKPTPHVQTRGPCYFSPVLEFASVLMVRCPWIQATTKLLNLPTRGGLGPGLGGRAGQMAVEGEVNTEKCMAGPFLSLMWWQGPLLGSAQGPSPRTLSPWGPSSHRARSFSWLFPHVLWDMLCLLPWRDPHTPRPLPTNSPLGGSPWGPPAQPILSVTPLSVLPSRAPPHPHPL